MQFRITIDRVCVAILSFLTAGCIAPAVAAAAAEPAFGINLAGPVDWNSELPFVDVFRMSRPWISQREGAGWGKGPELDLDKRGYVRRLKPGCFAESIVCTIDGNHYPSGNYTMFFEGTGEIEPAGAATRVVSTKSKDGVTRMTFDVDASRGAIFLRLRKTAPKDPVRNIRVIMPGFEDTYEAEPFHPKFLERWRGVACIRFMDWMHTNGSSIRNVADRPRMNDATWSARGIPLEVMIDLCNRLACDAWFCVPHMADDDYVRKFASVVKKRLDRKRRVYVELSNEVWNGGFQQQHYAQAQAKRLGIGSPEHGWEASGKWYARRCVEIFAIFNDVFGEKKGQKDGRLVRVIAGQASNSWWSEHVILPAEVPGGRASDFADVLAIAPYVGLVPTPNGKPSSDDVAGWSVDQVMDHVENVALKEAIRAMNDQARIAKAHGLALVAYEAGQHLVGAGGGENNDKLTELLQRANRDPRMGKVYDAYFKAWEDADGELLCHFSSVGTWSKWGSWGLLQYADDDPKASPKYQAVRRWRSGLARTRHQNQRRRSDPSP